MSGLHRPGTYRFFTLTSSPQSPDIQQSWHRLKARLDRRGMLGRYIRVSEWNQKGTLVHYHVVYDGKFIWHGLLRAWWWQIHKATIDIRKVYGKDGAAAYMAKHLAKLPANRLSYSWSWCWRGFAGDWKRFLYVAWRVAPHTSFDRLLKQWEEWTFIGVRPQMMRYISPRAP